MFPQSSISTDSTDGHTAPDKPALLEGPIDNARLVEDLQDRRVGIKIPYSALAHLVASFDAAVILFASVVGTGLYQILANSGPDHLEPVLGVGPVAALLYVLIGYSTGLYDLRAALAKKRRDAGRIFAQWSLVSLLLTLLAFLMKSGAVYSRGSVICFGCLRLFFWWFAGGLPNASWPGWWLTGK